MTILGFVNVVYNKYTSRELTDAYNSMELSDRIKALEYIGQDKESEVLNVIRKQAVKDF